MSLRREERREPRKRTGISRRGDNKGMSFPMGLTTNFQNTCSDKRSILRFSSSRSMDKLKALMSCLIFVLMRIGTCSTCPHLDRRLCASRACPTQDSNPSKYMHNESSMEHSITESRFIHMMPYDDEGNSHRRFNFVEALDSPLLPSNMLNSKEDRVGSMDLIPPEIQTPYLFEWLRCSTLTPAIFGLFHALSSRISNVFLGKRLSFKVTYWRFLCAIAYLFCSCCACTDVGESIRNGETPQHGCIRYEASNLTFQMSCSFAWRNSSNCIVLRRNERFEGNGHTIDLTGISNWEGLFQIADSSTSDGASSLQDAPLVHGVHMIHGETSDKGGFIIRSQQNHFIVNNCSSSGVIAGGGMCGEKCSGDILISHCWSSGVIQGWNAGGIAGLEVGLEGEKNNTVTISHCYSTGGIVGARSGGICGRGAGSRDRGMVRVEQCYTLGEIRGPESGGLMGSHLASHKGHVSVTNSYSRGQITGSNHAGGICGRFVGSRYGVVVLENVYASGQIIHPDAGGLIGSFGSDAKVINITLSVYSGDTGVMIANPSFVEANKEKNSADLTDITGTVYCYDEGEQNRQKCWDDKNIWESVEDDFPVLQGIPQVAPTTVRCIDNTNDFSGFSCLEYDSSLSMFVLTCSFHWSDIGYDCILLRENEVFQGHAHHVTISGYSNWGGLFRIAGSNSSDNAPVIRNVHVIGGQTSVRGGFLVQAFQKHFVVKSCSSTGKIRGSADSELVGGGGICGHGCSGDILIVNCWSSGEIGGWHAGGITGSRLGLDRNGNDNISISQCFSTGDIVGSESGGICGHGAGQDSDGMVIIEQCYSVGEIRGPMSGGITGSDTARTNGHVFISNCYSRGNISGSWSAGGVCGWGVSGTVILTNVYASGYVIHEDAGSLLGHRATIANHLGITMCVYNNDTGKMIGSNTVPDLDQKNSGDLNDIVGTAYCYDGGTHSECWDNETVWKAVDGDFPILRNVPTASPNVTASPIPPTPVCASIKPDSIEIEQARNAFDAPIIEKTVMVSLRRKQMFRWHEPDRPFLKVGKDMIEAGEYPQEIQQVIKILSGKALRGKTESYLLGDVIDQERVVSVLSVNISMEITQGYAQASTDALSVIVSQAGPRVSRPLSISNTGSRSITWWVSVFDNEGKPQSVSNALRWLSIGQRGGNVAAAKTNRILWAYFHPDEVDSIGYYQAWILVETDSWDGEKQSISSSAPGALQTLNATSVHFWIQVDMIVTAIFLCRGSEAFPLQPMQTVTRTFTIVNTETKDVTVIPSNFSLVMPTTDFSTNSVYPLERQVVGRNILLTPWMSLSPAVVSLGTGASVTYELRVSFLNTTLRLWSNDSNDVNVSARTTLSLQLGFGVFLGAMDSLQVKNADDFREVCVDLSFEPGRAVANVSYIEIYGTNTTEVPIRQPIEISVVLVDQFGQNFAEATYYSACNVDNEDESNVCLRSIESEEIRVRGPRLSDGEKTSGFSFTVEFTSEGEAQIDVVLNGFSVLGSPAALHGSPIQCMGPYETPSNDGSRCMCKAGYHRLGYHRSQRQSNSGTLGCVPCEQGTMTTSANQEFQCNLCPEDSFCPPGSSTYHPCLQHGVDCMAGKLRLKDEFWCEPCQGESHPRETIIRRLTDDSETIVFHQCFRVDSCIVNSTSFKSSCNRGYTGPVCSVCDDNFALNPENTACVECSDNGLDESLVAIGIVMAIVVLVVVTYRYSLKARFTHTIGTEHGRCSQETAEVNTDSTNVSREHNGALQSQQEVAPTYLEDLILLILDYLQICAILATLQISPFQRVSSFLGELSDLSLLNPTHFSQFKCTFGLGYFEHAVLSMIFPWIAFVGICVCQIIVVKVILGAPLTRKSLLQGTLPVSLIVFDLLHASVTSVTLGALRTYPNEVYGSTRASGDLTMTIGSSQHDTLFTIAILTLAIFVLGFPLIATAALLFKWKQEKFRELYIRFDSRTRPFVVRRPGFVWPTVVIFRKLALLLVSEFVEGAVSQYLAISVALVASCVLVAWVHPYRYQLLNHAEEFKIALALITAGLGFISYSLVSLSKPHFSSAENLLASLVIAFQTIGTLTAGVAGVLTFPRLVKKIRYILIPKASWFLREKLWSLCRREPETASDEVLMSNPFRKYAEPFGESELAPEQLLMTNPMAQRQAAEKDNSSCRDKVVPMIDELRLQRKSRHYFRPQNPRRK